MPDQPIAKVELPLSTQHLEERVKELEAKDEQTQQHLRDAMSRLADTLVLFDAVSGRVGTLERSVHVHEQQLVAHEHRLNDLRPIPLNCPKCSRKVSPHQERCGHCSTDLR